MSNSIENWIKVFGMTNHLVLDDLHKIEKKYDIELFEADSPSLKETDYYPQFEQSVRSEASSMAAYYEVFYCLEKSIRKLIHEFMKEEEGEDWWNSGRVSEKIMQDVAFTLQREIDSGVTRRSDDNLDYTTFGQLSNIICSNWDIFGSVFNSKKAVERVMSNLNMIRGPIAHCTLLSEDEEIRLKLTVKDWFRLMM